MTLEDEVIELIHGTVDSFATSGKFDSINYLLARHNKYPHKLCYNLAWLVSTLPMRSKLDSQHIDTLYKKIEDSLQNNPDKDAILKGLK